jgi:uncharacterized protein
MNSKATVHDRMVRRACITGLLLILSTQTSFAADTRQSAATLSDLMPAAITDCTLPPSAPAADVIRHSYYVDTPDHAKLAVDVSTSARLMHGAKVPTLFLATRYWRARDGDGLNEAQRRWIAAGYAVVNADVRGTGASPGQWYIPYSPQEARDLGFLANWIGQQDWSNGAVVMTGGSYPGTTPLLAAAYGTPALKAIAPKFSDYDLYADLLWPGGVPAEDLMLRWGRLVRGLDLNQPEPEDGAVSGAASVRPVDGPEGRALLGKAVEEHRANPWSFERVGQEVAFRDQRSGHMHGMSIEDGAVYTHNARIERSAIPIFGWGSWLDSGIAQGLLNRFMTLSNPQLTIIGPWTHGAHANANVFALDAVLEPTSATQDQWVHCYLNHYASNARGLLPSHRILYFTMGENRWKTTDVWPLPETRSKRFYLDAEHSLSEQTPATAARDEYSVDFEATTGPANRWATQAGAPRIDYGDRAQADKRLLTYTSPPLKADLEITGQPIVTLNVISTRTDGNFIVYLEDVLPDGQVVYLTEGELRAVHRKLSTRPAPFKTTYPNRTYSQNDALPLVPGEMASLVFQLQGTSVRLAPGHRLRLAVAGADRGTFMRIPGDGEMTVEVARGGRQASFIEVPEVP